MKPTMTTDAATSANGINIPINRGEDVRPQFQPVHYAHQQSAANGSPHSHLPPQSPQSSNWHQHPTSHFQDDFGFGPDIDMFPRNRLGRMHDPFTGFGNSHFSFPQFGTMGRRRVQGDSVADEDDFFTSLPPEFRQYIPANVTHRRAGPQMQQPTHPSQYEQLNEMAHSTAPYPAKKLCDAAIQTEELGTGLSETDNISEMEPRRNPLEEQNLRNTVDIGALSSAPENEFHGVRSSSAPQQTEEVLQKHTMPLHEADIRRTSPTAVQNKQASGNPHSSETNFAQHQMNAIKTGVKPEEMVRTIPIFVESRSQLINNAELDAFSSDIISPATRNITPNQENQPLPQQQQPPHQQQQQEQLEGSDDKGVPQTPHTLDSINKIQNIQRDVLDLMGKVETFTGRRQDKEYKYLDEMLTRNLLKLDTIDTNGKDSIRLARKEAIKCIQASINVLDAKAEENSKTVQDSKVDEENESSEAQNLTSDLQPSILNALTNPESSIPIPLHPPEENQDDHINLNSVQSSADDNRNLQVDKTAKDRLESNNENNKIK